MTPDSDAPSTKALCQGLKGVRRRGIMVTRGLKKNRVVRVFKVIEVHGFISSR